MNGRAQWSSRVLRTRLGTVTLERSLARGRSRLLDEEEAALLMAALNATQGSTGDAARDSALTDADPAQ